MFGTDYPTADGTCIRDDVHVPTWRAPMCWRRAGCCAGGENLKVNLGSGRGSSIKQVLGAIEAVVGHAVPVVYRERRAGDPAELYADASLAREKLGFVAELSDLGDDRADRPALVPHVRCAVRAETATRWADAAGARRRGPPIAAAERRACGRIVLRSFLELVVPARSISATGWPYVGGHGVPGSG